MTGHFEKGAWIEDKPAGTPQSMIIMNVKINVDDSQLKEVLRDFEEWENRRMRVMDLQRAKERVREMMGNEPGIIARKKEMETPSWKIGCWLGRFCTRVREWCP
ncbi:MAG: hypothetical protein M0Q92_15755 [Methanoregula sp.]|jgi:hypothetical protein|nr:hypothetical protein [Methanoregula sp.]